MPPLKRLFVYGFPSRYGGAGTELHHQIIAWVHMGLEVHIIPTNPGYPREPLYHEMLQRGVKIHEANDFSVLNRGDPILGFCNAEFLEALPLIRAHTSRTVFLNCMTWLFDKEREQMSQGMIAMFLYQNDEVRIKQMPELRALNGDPNIRFMTVKPYFQASAFPFHTNRDEKLFGCGRISRQDADKFADNTLEIYDSFVSPKPKSGIFLGFDARSEEKIGTPFDWIRVAHDHNQISQQDFYRHCDIVLQLPMQTLRKMTSGRSARSAWLLVAGPPNRMNANTSGCSRAPGMRRFLRVSAL